MSEKSKKIKMIKRIIKLDGKFEKVTDKLMLLSCDRLYSLFTSIQDDIIAEERRKEIEIMKEIKSIVLTSE